MDVEQFQEGQLPHCLASTPQDQREHPATRPALLGPGRSRLAPTDQDCNPSECRSTPNRHQAALSLEPEQQRHRVMLSFPTRAGYQDKRRIADDTIHPVGRQAGAYTTTTDVIWPCFYKGDCVCG